MLEVVVFDDSMFSSNVSLVGGLVPLLSTLHTSHKQREKKSEREIDRKEFYVLYN